LRVASLVLASPSAGGAVETLVDPAGFLRTASRARACVDAKGRQA